MAKKDFFPLLNNVMLTGFSSLGDVAKAIPIIYPVCYDYPDISFVLPTNMSNVDFGRWKFVSKQSTTFGVLGG